IMVLFWLTSFALLLISIIVILKTLFSKNKSNIIYEDNSKLLYEQKLLEIDKDIENNTLTSKDAENIKIELKNSLLEYKNKSDVLSLNIYRSSKNVRKIISLILILIIPVFVFGIYSIVGSPDSIEKLALTSNISNSQSSNEQLASVDEMLNHVERRLLDNPDNTDDWLMLANSYLVLKRYPESIRAFENLYRLKGDEPSLLLRYADALAMANSGVFSGKPAEMIKKALVLDPENTMGLWLAGLVSYEEGKIDEAINYWEKVLPKLKDGSEEQSNIKKYLEFAYQNNNIPREENTPDLSNRKKYSIKLNIELSSDFYGIDKNQIVFIYAKSEDKTNNMPIIVLRKKVADLPLTIELDDSMVMLPSNKLSDYQSVRVIARVSKSGNAKANKGDPIGVIDSISTDSKETAELIINKKVE
ncbi:MAG: c-type cytochrome biogenesis protein CcmI, partial [Pseudomonadota bacterium]|nr:c-type cytochrome biogenesis protein CcmI [Pseudomonadota bacterium]